MPSPRKVARCPFCKEEQLGPWALMGHLWYDHNHISGFMYWDTTGQLDWRGTRYQVIEEEAAS